MEAVLEYVLSGLEAWLETERELGVRQLEVDRTLLAPASPAPKSVATPCPPPVVNSPALAFAFLHDRPLSPGGVEMMAKIITALGKTEKTAPVVIAPPLPPAKIYVVLGARAMKKYFPELKGEPGNWLKTAKGQAVLITYSPEFILRFPTITEAVKTMKQQMWLSLKSVKQRAEMG